MGNVIVDSRPAGFLADLLRQFPNPVFVETGTFSGYGLWEALQAGFSEIIGIELDPDLYQMCARRFGYNPQIKLYCGDSGDLLYDVLRGCPHPITFFLDAHYSGEGTAKGKTNTPILYELDAIHKLAGRHTILIDDANQFGTAAFDGITGRQIESCLKSINPDYKLLVFSGDGRGDVLAAIPQEA